MTSAAVTREYSDHDPMNQFKDAGIIPYVVDSGRTYLLLAKQQNGEWGSFFFPRRGEDRAQWTAAQAAGVHSRGTVGRVENIFARLNTYKDHGIVRINNLASKQVRYLFRLYDYNPTSRRETFHNRRGGACEDIRWVAVDELHKSMQASGFERESTIPTRTEADGEDSAEVSLTEELFDALSMEGAFDKLNDIEHGELRGFPRSKSIMRCGVEPKHVFHLLMLDGTELYQPPKGTRRSYHGFEAGKAFCELLSDLPLSETPTFRWLHDNYRAMSSVESTVRKAREKKKPQLASRIADRYHQKLDQLQENHAFAITCVAKGKKWGHAMMLKVTKNDSGDFSVTLYNTGKGVRKHHERVRVEGQKRYAPLCIDGVSEQDLKDFLSQAARWNAVEERVEDIDIFYGRLRTLGHEAPPISQRRWVAAQQDGTCSFFCQKAFAAGELPPEEFLLFDTNLRVRAIIEYYNTSGGLDRQMAEEIQCGIDYVISQLNQFELKARGVVDPLDVNKLRFVACESTKLLDNHIQGLDEHFPEQDF